MNINIEQVEKLKERADVSYADAKSALERSGGDLLEAMIHLETQGKVSSGRVGCFDSRSAGAESGNSAGGKQKQDSHANGSRQSFGSVMRCIWRFICRIVHKGNTNHFEIHRAGSNVASIPVTILVLLLLLFFWVTLPLLVIGLFFGCRYSFCGPDLGKENINHAMSEAATAAENLKRTVQEKAAESDKPQE